MGKEKKLKKIIKAFIDKHEISCAEGVHQNDRVVIAATELIEELCDVVGYRKFEDE